MNECKAFTDLILSVAFSKENENASKDELIETLKPYVLRFMDEQRTIGRNQILEGLAKNIDYLKWKNL